MESGKSEAGSSTVGGSSGCVVRDEEKDKQREMAESRGEDSSADHGSDSEKEDGVVVAGFVPGPPISLREQLEKDKDDESLRRWKEKLLGSLESDLNDQMDPEVKFHSIGIISDDFGEISTPLPVSENQSGGVLFTLREGSRYQLKLTFTVMHNIVCGLTYSNTVWKAGIQVDESKGMLGTFAPQREPYVNCLEEETTPSGVLARGIYSAKLKFKDDDGRCHMELKYLEKLSRVIPEQYHLSFFFKVEYLMVPFPLPFYELHTYL